MGYYTRATIVFAASTLVALIAFYLALPLCRPAILMVTPPIIIIILFVLLAGKIRDWVHGG